VTSDTVLIGGVFDPLHAGHVAYVEAARAYGRVVCAISNNPAKHPPLVPLWDCAVLLKRLGVDTFTGMSIVQAIAHFTPKYYIKGRDWEGKLPAEEVEACARHGVAIVYTDTMQQSSSRLLADYERARNAEKLAAFERVVAEQQPADKPWEPVTDYSRETRRAIEAPQADIIADVFQGCSVLDYGCGFGYLAELLRERDMHATGWDPYQPDSPAVPTASDLVICREVLEHVPISDLQDAILDIVSLAARFIYVTTRFTAKPHLLDVDTADDLDPTHITLLNQDFLRTLFVLHGCTRRADLEERLDHQRKGRVLVYEVPR
jgi:SAM-dependent methyltransferase